MCFQKLLTRKHCYPATNNFGYASNPVLGETENVGIYNKLKLDLHEDDQKEKLNKYLIEKLRVHTKITNCGTSQARSCELDWLVY